MEIVYYIILKVLSFKIMTTKEKKKSSKDDFPKENTKCEVLSKDDFPKEIKIFAKEDFMKEKEPSSQRMISMY